MIYIRKRKVSLLLEEKKLMGALREILSTISLIIEIWKLKEYIPDSKKQIETKTLEKEILIREYLIYLI